MCQSMSRFPKVDFHCFPLTIDKNHLIAEDSYRFWFLYTLGHKNCHKNYQIILTENYFHPVVGWSQTPGMPFSSLIYCKTTQKYISKAYLFLMGREFHHPVDLGPTSLDNQCILVQSILWASWLLSHLPNGIHT